MVVQPFDEARGAPWAVLGDIVADIAEISERLRTETKQSHPVLMTRKPLPKLGEHLVAVQRLPRVKLCQTDIDLAAKGFQLLGLAQARLDS